jgi:hypothetical protein
MIQKMNAANGRIPVEVVVQLYMQLGQMDCMSVLSVFREDALRIFVFYEDEEEQTTRPAILAVGAWTAQHDQPTGRVMPLVQDGGLAAAEKTVSAMEEDIAGWSANPRMIIG